LTRLPKIILASTKPLKVQQINWKVRNNVTGGQTNEEQFHGNQVGRIPVGFLLDSCWIPVVFARSHQGFRACPFPGTTCPHR
jgi:hypothetical protein